MNSKHVIDNEEEEEGSVSNTRHAIKMFSRLVRRTYSTSSRRFHSRHRSIDRSTRHEIKARAMCTNASKTPLNTRSIISRHEGKIRTMCTNAPKPPPNTRTFSRGPVSWASLFVAGVVGVGIYGYYSQKRQEKLTRSVKNSKTVGKALLGGPFQMVDSEGVPVTNETFKGQWMVLYFGFTYCPDICPNELVKLGKVLNRLDKDLGPVVTPVFISVDPKRDSVKQLAFYKKDFHPRMRFLTGTPEQVKRAAKAYRVYYSNTNTTSDEDDWDYLVDHSIVMYFISPEGEFLEFFTQSADVDEIVDRMSAHIKS